MYIHGIGIISCSGRGLKPFASALSAQISSKSEDGFSRVSDADLKDPLIAKEARRSSRFDRMAILAGLDALKDARTRIDIDASSLGLILATGYGPHVTTFRFLDDMIDFKEQDVSPTLFSHSVHNAAASYLSLMGGLRAPTLTVTHFSSAFEEALVLAEAWLRQSRCRYVLLGVVDELGAVMDQAIVAHTNNRAPLGEGSVFFVLSLESQGHNEVTVGSIRASVDRLAPETLSLSLWGKQPGLMAYRYASTAMLLCSACNSEKIIPG